MNTSCVVLNFNDSVTTIKLVNIINKFKIIDYIVIVDNCSTDNSFSELKKLKSKKIMVIKTDHNGGYGFGNNYGIKYSYSVLNASYTLIANPDVIFTEELVYKLKTIIISNIDVAIAAAVPIDNHGKCVQRPAWKLPTTFKEIFSSSVIINKIFSLHIDYDNDYLYKASVVDVEVVQGSMLMLDTNLMIRYGMYDENMFLYGEEQVIAKKLKENFLRTLLLTTEQYVHNHSVSINKSYNTAVKKRKLLIKSKLYYLKKYKNINFFEYVFAFVFLKATIIEVFIIKKIQNIFLKRKA